MSGKSASPTVRALDELKRIHESEIEKLSSDEFYAAVNGIENISKSLEKQCVDKIVAAIKELDLPFRPEHTSLCNIRQYNGKLLISLVFDEAKNKETLALSKKRDEVLERRRNATADLEAWYIKSLYDIAGRSNVTEFKIKR